MRREPVKVLVGEGVLPAPPLPLKPAVMSPAPELCLVKAVGEGALASVDS